MRPAARRSDRRRLHPQGRRRRRVALPDILLGIVLAWGLARTAWPTILDIRASHMADQVISTMTGTTDETHDETRMAVLAQAQAYNLRLGGAAPPLDNEGLEGGNGGGEDILDLASSVGDDAVLPYDEQLSWKDGDLLGWVEVRRIGIRQPLYRGTEDETLALGVGHLDWSSLPVGGPSSHCVLAAHSGMHEQRMFDDIDRLVRGDVFVVHTLGDAYQYEVYETEVVEPEEAAQRCSIVEGEDLCTLVTCTPYGINSHRLLVHGRRVAYEAPSEGVGTHVTRLATNSRTRPVLTLSAVSVPLALVACLARLSRRQRRVRHRRVATLLCLVMGSGLMAAGTTTVARHVQSTLSTRRLARTVVRDTASVQEGLASVGETDQTVDWDALWQANGDVVAWVRVEGTDIDLPVVSPADKGTTHYLRHDLWGAWNLEGTPFLDHRCEADGPHRLVFGHHLAMGGQFSMLQHAYQQDCFDSLGRCHWYTPARGEVMMEPLCALRVDQCYGFIQRFDFEDDESLRTWLAAIVRNAPAASSLKEQLTQDARSVVTLVTCSSDLARQRWRTLVVYVEADDGEAGRPPPT